MLTPLPPPPGDPPPKPASGRDVHGRFAKGSAGNRGRKKGSKNRTTQIVEALFEGEAEAVGRTAIELALKGDVTALRLVLERVAPLRKGRAVEIPGFPKVDTIADVPAAHSALIAAVADGTVTPDEARPLSDLLTSFTGALDAAALQLQLDEIMRRLDEADSIKARRAAYNGT